MPIPAFQTPEPRPTIWVYETEGMAKVRQLLTDEDDISDYQVDTFKACLLLLEKHGFALTRCI